MYIGSYNFISNDELMENVQYNNMQEKKSCNDNLKGLIICYGCSKLGHIQRNYSILKIQGLQLKFMNKVLC